MRNGKILQRKHTGNSNVVKAYFITLYIIVQSTFSFAQSVAGKITTFKNNEPIAGVTVIVDDSIGLNSDMNGNYRIQLDEGAHNVKFKMISFETQNHIIYLTVKENLALNIYMHPSPQLIKAIVVSAGKFEQRLEDVTVSMEVLKPELVEKRNTVTMEDAVDYIPGVNVIDGQVNIRGGSGWSYGAGSRVQILVDDLPQLTADANDTKWTFLPIENIEQVEVLKGASSVLFGSSALNGVINFRTAYPRDTPVTKINLFAALYDKAYITTDKKYSLNYQEKLSSYRGFSFLHSRKIKKLELTTSGNYFKDNGYRQGENEERGKIGFNSRYSFKLKGLSAGLSVNTIVTKGTLFFLWKNDTTGAYLPALNTLSDYKTYRTAIDPSLTYVGSHGSSHKIRTRWFNNTNTNNTNQYSRGDLFYTEYQYQKHFENSLIITTGIVDIFSRVNSEMFGDHKGNQSAAYLQGDFNVKKWTFSGGGRVEQSKVDEIKDKWTPVFRSGINYRLLEATYLRASAGQGYRFPSVAERFVRTNVSGISIFPNIDLQPEKGFSVEAGIKQGYAIGRWKGMIDIAVFENDYKNMMEFVFAQWATEFGFLQNSGFKSVNVGKTRIRGIDFSMVGEGNLGREFHLTAMISYTLLDPRQLTYDSAYIKKIGVFNYLGSDSSDFLKYRYRHMVKGDVELGWKKWSLGGSVRYNSRMQNIDKIFTIRNGLLDFAFPPGLGIADYLKYRGKGDLIIDSRVSYKASKYFEVQFIVKNLLNYIYMQRPADMQPPRTFVLQTGLRF